MCVCVCVCVSVCVFVVRWKYGVPSNVCFFLIFVLSSAGYVFESTHNTIRVPRLQDVYTLLPQRTKHIRIKNERKYEDVWWDVRNMPKAV